MPPSGRNCIFARGLFTRGNQELANAASAACLGARTGAIASSTLPASVSKCTTHESQEHVLEWKPDSRLGESPLETSGAALLRNGREESCATSERAHLDAPAQRRDQAFQLGIAPVALYLLAQRSDPISVDLDDASLLGIAGKLRLSDDHFQGLLHFL